MAGSDYLAHYQHKQLNEVVIPGAHDAGVFTSNRGNVRTQRRNIGEQASDGCRFFDMRIATNKVTVGGKTVYEHQAYHLDGKAVIGKKDKSQSVSHMGGWGGRLTDMLIQARNFVMQNKTEFLILKFSKSFDWEGIAETALVILEGHHYKDGGNLNNKKVRDLAGKVITVFDEQEMVHLAAIKARFGKRADGLLPIRPLFDGKTTRAYDPTFEGMQYFGKFSSTSDIADNTKKQAKILNDGAATHMDALGMMYWTTTGLVANIEKRNAKMWSDTNIASLQKTWESGLEASISARFGREKNAAMQLAMTTGGALGGRLKAFMPNIVMMDFVNADKCETVRQLNAVASTALLSLYVPTPKGPQPHPKP